MRADHHWHVDPDSPVHARFFNGSGQDGMECCGCWATARRHFSTNEHAAGRASYTGMDSDIFNLRVGTIHYGPVILESGPPICPGYDLRTKHQAVIIANVPGYIFLSLALLISAWIVLVHWGVSNSQMFLTAPWWWILLPWFVTGWLSYLKNGHAELANVAQEIAKIRSQRTPYVPFKSAYGVETVAGSETTSDQVREAGLLRPMPHKPLAPDVVGRPPFCPDCGEHHFKRTAGSRPVKCKQVDTAGDSPSGVKPG